MSAHVQAPAVSIATQLAEIAEGTDPEPDPKRPSGTSSPLQDEIGNLDLTPFETQIICLIVEASSRQEMEETLAISADVLKAEIDKLFEKLGVGSEFELILFAVYHHLVDSAVADEGPAV